MKFQKSSGAYLPLDTESCTVTRMGDIVEVRTMTANPIDYRRYSKKNKVYRSYWPFFFGQGSFFTEYGI